MTGILQGTTPKLEITVPETVPLDSVTAIELTLQHKGARTILGMDDVTIDTDANTITLQFTEAQTLSLDPGAMLIWQLRLKNPTGIVGTRPSSLAVFDLLSEVMMP